MTDSWGLLGSFQMGAGHQKDWGRIRRLGLSTPSPNLQGGERGWSLTWSPMVNDVIIHTLHVWRNTLHVWSYEASITTKRTESGELLRCWRYGDSRRVVHWKMCGSSVPLPICPTLHVCSIWLLIHSLCDTLCNKCTNANKMFPRVLAN